MRREEVQQLLISVKSGNEESFHVKIYKEGTITRRGCGGLPEIGIAALIQTGNSELFYRIMEKVPDTVLADPIIYQDPEINNPIEYLLAFYSDSSNGQTGEGATWTKSTGIRLLIDAQTKFAHPILPYVDTLALEAAERTNTLYFDVMMQAVYGVKAVNSPPAFIATPPSAQQTHESFNDYIMQMHGSARKWDIVALGNNRKYKNADGIFTLRMELSGDTYNFSFLDADGEPYKGPVNKKAWWKFW